MHLKARSIANGESLSHQAGRLLLIASGHVRTRETVVPASLAVKRPMLSRGIRAMPTIRPLTSIVDP